MTMRKMDSQTDFEQGFNYPLLKKYPALDIILNRPGSPSLPLEKSV